jgi:hypothetical protein
VQEARFDQAGKGHSGRGIGLTDPISGRRWDES